MYQPVEAPHAYNERRDQAISPAAHPQLCGSWPGDEWPDASGQPSGGPVNLCAGSPVVYPAELWSCPDQPSGSMGR
jgi:hypothetical protein